MKTRDALRLLPTRWTRPPASEDGPAGAGIAARGVTVRYGGNVAVRDAPVTVHPGRMVAVVGGQGAGKSSLVNAVAGWSRGRPSVTGEVLLDGRDISRLAAHRRARLGVVLVPEGKGVFDQLSVEDNLRLVPAPAGDRRPFGFDEIYELFPRLHERRIHKGSALSGGERQMLAVARALRAAPNALLLDEPSVGLAPRLVLDLLERVRQLADRGLAVLLVEQNVRAALDVVHHLYLLERGSVVAEGGAEEMRDDARLTRAYLGRAA